MKLNQVETLLMNNPVRAALQRHYEARLLERLGGRLEGATVLEIGCGRGVGAEILVQRFGAARVFAFDLDPAMARRARKRLARFGPGRVQAAVADASRIPFPDKHFDAVVDFGIIHHIPDWQAVLLEVRRVLKPGGRFFFEEVTRHALERWSYRTFLVHPEENRFSGGEFTAELERAGFEDSANHVTRFFGDFVIGVARRPQECSTMDKFIA